MSQILIVEDDPVYRYVAKKALDGAGYSVTVADGYLQALKVLENNESVRLLLTDIVMKDGINGIALSRMARMRRADLKILYMTAYDVPEGEAGDKILRKPLSNESLLEEVRQALDG